MSAGYTKLFASILDSTIWLETDPTRIVWITMLAKADQFGDVAASVPGLAHAACVTLEDCQKAIAIFLAPDAHSRTKDNDGRRIGVIDGGWRLLNHAKYRQAMRSLERKEYLARKQRESRARRIQSTNVNKSTIVNQSQPISEAEAEATTEGPGHPLSGGLGAKPPEAGADAPAPPVVKKTDLQRRTEKLFGKRPTTPWSKAELTAWKTAQAIVADTTGEEWADLEAWCALPADRAPFRRNGFSALLNNWADEILRARRPENLAAAAAVAPDKRAAAESAARRRAF